MFYRTTVGSAWQHSQFILTWYREDGDHEGRPVGGRLMYCTPHAAEHLHWAKSVQMGYAIFGSGLVETSSPLSNFYKHRLVFGTSPAPLGGRVSVGRFETRLKIPPRRSLVVCHIICQRGPSQASCSKEKSIPIYFVDSRKFSILNLAYISLLRFYYYQPI